MHAPPTYKPPPPILTSQLFYAFKNFSKLLLRLVLQRFVLLLLFKILFPISYFIFYISFLIPIIYFLFPIYSFLLFLISITYFPFLFYYFLIPFSFYYFLFSIYYFLFPLYSVLLFFSSYSFLCPFPISSSFFRLTLETKIEIITVYGFGGIYANSTQKYAYVELNICVNINASFVNKSPSATFIAFLESGRKRRGPGGCLVV